MIDTLSFLTEIRNRDPHLGKLLEKLFDSVDGIGDQLGIIPNGKTQPPDPIKAINVKVSNGEQVHVTLHDPSAVRKGVQYFIEWSTNPSFAGAHVEHLGAGRGRVLQLPTFQDDGVTKNTYYVRGYSQLHGSDAQPQHVVFGGKYTPKAITLSGITAMTPLSSQGAGTAPTDGSRPGLGLGRDLRRLLPGPKVPVAPAAR